MQETQEQVAEVVVETILGEGAQEPTYATPGSAGMDLRISEDVTIEPMQRVLAKTGLKMAIPQGFEGQVRPRSGLAIKHGLALVNSPGTIDSDYRGEIGVIMINLGQETISLSKGDRVAQLVIVPVIQARVTIVNELTDTDRGDGGFGSTGSG